MTVPVLELLSGWGGSCRARSWVYRPNNPEEAAQALSEATSRGLTVVHRGAGLSYGDAALNNEGAVLDVSGIGRTVEVDAETGRAVARAGATVEDVWKAALPLGWWPPVVPGSMKATVGGCTAMDVHGKNHFQVGSFGEQVDWVRLLKPSGELLTVSREDEAAFAEVVGAQGLTGTIVDVSMRLQRVHSGHLAVESLATPSLDATLDALEERSVTSAHAVAWIDCLAGGRAAGRGVLHLAEDLPSDHGLSGRGLSVRAQGLPRRIMGVIPRGWAWWGLRALSSDPGVAGLNAGRYWHGRIVARRRHHPTHAAFHFLLDHVPGWKRAYGPDGLIQYQMFVGADVARFAFREALKLQRRSGVRSYLAVLKRHRAGRFAAPYSLEGYSLAMDLAARRSRAPALAGLCRDLDALLAEVGGRVYAAKDAVSVGMLPASREPVFSSDLVRRWDARGDRGP